MPTFIVYQGKDMVSTMSGWNESRMREILENIGVQKISSPPMIDVETSGREAQSEFVGELVECARSAE